MADEIFRMDGNSYPVIGAVTDDASQDTRMLRVDASTNALKVSISGGSTGVADDAAFTVGTTTVTPAGFLADETATDSVDEGDVGAARMTLDRKQLMASNYVDDTAFTPAGSASYVTLAGAEADDTSTDSVDEGDVGALRMSLRRAMYTSMDTLLAGEDQTNAIFATIEKPVAVNTYTPSLDTSAAAEASSVTKASSGNLYGATGVNSSASLRYWQVFNSTTVPADTTVPVICVAVPSGASFAMEWPKGREFSTGIAWCWSSTAATKTVGSTDGLVDVNYV